MPRNWWGRGKPRSGNGGPPVPANTGRLSAPPQVPPCPLSPKSPQALCPASPPRPPKFYFPLSAPAPQVPLQPCVPHLPPPPKSSPSPPSPPPAPLTKKKRLRRKRKHLVQPRQLLGLMPARGSHTHGLRAHPKPEPPPGPRFPPRTCGRSARPVRRRRLGPRRKRRGRWKRRGGVTPGPPWTMGGGNATPRCDPRERGVTPGVPGGRGGGTEPAGWDRGMSDR